MTAAQLRTTVFVKDPDTHQTVELHPGTCPEPRLAALVTNPSAWVDGKLPRLRLPQKPAPDADQQETPQDPRQGDGDGPGDTPGADSDTGSDKDSSPSAEPDEGTEGSEEKPPTRAAKKTAARKPAETAAEGTGGQ
ncbi:hypothetical protein [Streptomyces showdoensis]|nr:hypothetical protein [Streptomyces showdoensis]